MAERLAGRRVMVLATDGYEDSELTQPVKALRDEGATVEVVAPHSGAIQGKKGTETGVDHTVEEVQERDYDALVLPGGVANPDRLRMDRGAVALTRAFFDARKPVAAICHGPWMLVEADVLRGRRVTSWPSLRTDLRNAGAEWVDEEVVVDQGLVTSRKPDDLPAFCAKAIEEIGEGRHQGGRAAQ